jgi:hypothetical protein
MTRLLAKLFRRNPARELALLGVRKRRVDSYVQREKVRAVARAIREAKGLPPSRALQG